MMSHGIIEEVCAVTTVAVNTFASFGMELNFSASKSECVVEFVGKGKKKAINSMHNSGNAIDKVINNVKTINFKLPKVYKHVGTRYGANLNAEVFARCGIMSQGAGAIQKKVLQNTSIKLEKRLAILSAYIFTKGIFQCCTWSDLSPTASKRFHGAIMKAIQIYHRHVPWEQERQ